MKKKISILIGGLLAVAVLFGAYNVKTAYAQDSTTSNPIMQRGGGHGHGGERGLGQPELEAAARVLGITADELSTALADGKTLEDLAATANVDIQDVKDAITAVHADEMRTRIEAGVADGTISQEKADWLLEGLDKGFLDGPGGFGMGFGGPHGHGGRPDMQPNTTTAPTATP